MKNNQPDIYFSLFHNMDLGVVIQDATGKIISANPAAENILGVSMKEINQMTAESDVWSAIKEDGSQFNSSEHPATIALRTGKSVKDVIMGIIHPKLKSRVWIKINATPEFIDGEKKAFRVFATFANITNELNLEQQLVEKETEFKALFNNGPIGVAYNKLVYNEKGIADNFIFLDVNDNFIKIVGTDPRNKLVTEVLPGIENEPWDWIGNLCRCGQYGETIRFERYLKAVKKWYNLVAYKSSEGHFVTVFFDVTKERELQKQVREKAFLVESSGNAIAMINLDKNLTYVNNSFLKIWGYSQAKEVIGRSVFDFWDIEKEFEKIREMLKADGVVIQEVRAISKAGELINVSTSLSAVLDEDGVAIGFMTSSEDISEFQKIKEAQIESEKRYRMLFERSNNPIFLVDLSTGEYLDANVAAIKLVGRSLEELKGLKTELITPKGYNKRLKQINKNEEVSNFGEVEYLRPDGSIKYAILSVVPIGNRKAFGIANDITEVKKNENEIKAYNDDLFATTNALKKSNVELEAAINNIDSTRAKVTSIIENTTDSIWAIDKNYDVIYINHVFKKEFEQSFNISLQVGDNILKLLPDFLKPMWKDRYDKALSNEQFVFEDKIELAPEVFVYIQVGMNPIVSEGKVIGASFFGSNITRRKEIEAEIITANKELQKTTFALTKSNKELEVALVEAKRSKALEIANEKLLEREKELNEKQQRLEKLHLALHDNHIETQQLNEELISTNEELYIKKDALQKTLYDLKQTQSHLIQSEKMASMGTLTAGVAHELNNPLNFIFGSAQIFESYIDDELSEHKSNLQQFIDNIYVGVDRASEIIKSLNHFSRKNEEVDEICSMHLIIDNCLTMLNNQLKYKANVKTHYTDEEFSIMGNEGKLHQLFVNILSNSIDAIERDGFIEIRSEVEKQKLNVTIKDNGSGISKENLNKIMDPFFTTKPPGKGTGLGLSIVYTIIEEHKAIVSYDSILNEGTTVVLGFPLIDKRKS